ncbi:hypothetical protein E1A91_D06G222300v1 [Gossypium mustelinum]|uniref:Metal transporter n=1 Tax=Gossypium mustelinum TaxID=34275 RepID=A0A5D2UR79_GOSMU|nr:hypothetical protein E1A91_D06G222300v1 [Gossypium mustelinum]
MGYNPIASLNVEPDTPLESSSNNNSDPNHDQKYGWRNFLSFIGLVETDLQAGASHGYELLWVVLIGLVFTLIIQSLAANLGVSTGKHLSEKCKAEYPRMVKYCLWILAEIAVIAADIPEVIGTTFGLNILFNIPVWVRVSLTEKVRKLEMLIAVLVFVMVGCFFREMSYVKPPASGVVKGMFFPILNGQGATGDAIALLDALRDINLFIFKIDRDQKSIYTNLLFELFELHNIFLHSALVLSRKVPSSARGVNDAYRYFLIESGIALFVAFLINVVVVSVANQKCCNDLNLNSASFLLQNVLGKSSKALYDVALLASGQSSTITGTYAGQFIVQGFLNLHMKKWVRNIMTRCIAITPSLIVSIIGGSQGAGRLIIIASMILSFELPFALIPLLKFSSSSTKIGT